MTTRSAWGLGLATVTDDGNTLDVWYPSPRLGDEPEDGDAALLERLSAMETRDEARKLTEALRGNTGRRGRWGEQTVRLVVGKVEIAPGPNNPVGSVWLGLTKPHWGIHGTPEPAKVGHSETNGCIHLTNWDAERLAKIVKVGAKVDVKA